MSRREQSQFLARLAGAAGDLPPGDDARRRTQVLRACVRAMRRLRSLPSDPEPGEDRCPFADLLCDPAADDLLRRDDALGVFYQALNAPALAAAYRATARDRRKFVGHEVPAVTQLFTPRWVVEFLLHNTLGRLWLGMHPDSRLGGALRWLVPLESGTEGMPKRVREIRVLDPACGTMNFGLVVIELLEAMYREEMDRAGEPGWPEPSVCDATAIGPSILRDNLFGIDLDPVALQLARQAIEMKLGRAVPDNACTLRQGDALFNSKIGSECRGAFHVVVTNPPYLSARNLPEATVKRMKRKFPAAWRDQYACFIERCLDFAAPAGRVGMLAMQSFMFTGSFEALRQRIAERSAVETIAHFGGGLFDVGNPGTLQTAAFVLRKEGDSSRRARQKLVAFRVVRESDEGAKRDALQEQIACAAKGRAFALCQSDLQSLPRGAWSYWISPDLRRAFCAFGRLKEWSPPRQGLATTDNARFVRFWWEVEPLSRDPAARAVPGRWFAYAKGGQFRRWYEAPRHRVNWEDDGREIKASIAERYPYLKGQWEWVAKNTAYYGRGGVCWSYLTSGRFSARRLETGAIFDVAGSSIFPDDPLGLLAILNSSIASRLMAVINPTVNFQVGDLAELPIPRQIPQALRDLAARAIDLQHRLDAFDEATTDFLSPPPWQDGLELVSDLCRRLAEIGREVDGAVAELYAVPTDHDPGPPGLQPLSAAELAGRWASFAVGVALGRWGGRGEPLARIAPVDPVFLHRLREILREKAGELPAAQIESAVGGLERFLGRDFYPRHVRMYQRRPVYLALGTREECYLIAHDAATAANLRPILAALDQPSPAGWERCVDDGILVNLSPLWPLVPEPVLRKNLRSLDQAMREGRLQWAQTASRR